MEQDQALQLAVAFLVQSQRENEPPLAIDAERVRESNGLLIVPYNSVQYLASGDPREQLLDCWHPSSSTWNAETCDSGPWTSDICGRTRASDEAAAARNRRYGTALSASASSSMPPPSVSTSESSSEPPGQGDSPRSRSGGRWNGPTAG